MTTQTNNWTKDQVSSLYEQPFNDLLYQAQQTHRENFNPNAVQTSTLLSIKTGACPEDCKYCSQSGRFKTKLDKQKLLSVDEVVAAAKQAKEAGASRFCMGAAWRSPPKKQMGDVIEMVKAVRELGMETCLTAGMLSEEQAQAFKEAGLDYYNHNLDSSPEYYKKIITTRSYQDRLDTLAHVRNADLKTCCGGIIGMGETRDDRIGLLCQLANLPTQPQSVPINRLVPIKGTPLGDTTPIDDFEFIRTIAIARIMMPNAMVRLSAGRETMSDAMQALCFHGGANSIFYGDKLLTTENNQSQKDKALLEKLDMKMMAEAQC